MTQSVKRKNTLSGIKSQAFNPRFINIVRDARRGIASSHHGRFDTTANNHKLESEFIKLCEKYCISEIITINILK
jgi:hypothetical protein